MRLLVVVLIGLVFIAAGIVFGALNPALVTYDLGFVQLAVPKGAAVLAALAAGWLVGGLVAWLGASARHRRRRPQAGRTRDKTAPTDGS